MQIITRKVFSVCDTFHSEYEHIYESLTECTSPDSYINYHITENDEASEILIQNGAELGEIVLIEIDY